MTEEKKNIPKLRFPEFKNAPAWEQRKLEEVAFFNPKAELPNVFEYIDLESVVGTELLCQKRIFKKNAPSRAQRLAKKGDLFYQTVRPYQKNNYLFEKTDEDYVFSTGYAQLRPNIDGYFLLSLVQHENFVQKVLDNCTGTSYPAINSQELSKIEIEIPNQQEEYIRIGCFFRIIDTHITYHQRKLDKLKERKKALLQRMFPKDGHTAPKLRFPGFTDVWEQRKVLELCEIATGKSNTQDQYENGKYDFYIRSDKPVKSNKYLYDCEAVLTVGDGNIGKIFYYVNGKFDLHQRVYKMTDFNELIFGKFFYHYFSTYFYKRAMSMTAKSTVDSVRLEMISHMTISFPLLEEQEAIYDLLDKLDTHITCQQRMLEHLKLRKKALLQQMFV